MGLVPSSTGVVLVGDLRVALLFGDAILVVPGPWLVNEGIGLPGLVGILLGSVPGVSVTKGLVPEV
jgi:hypothetical protein